MKLTVEKGPSKFLDTRLLINNGIYETEYTGKKQR